jgi:hypothetical protein
VSRATSFGIQANRLSRPTRESAPTKYRRWCAERRFRSGGLLLIHNRNVIAVTQRNEIKTSITLIESLYFVSSSAEQSYCHCHSFSLHKKKAQFLYWYCSRSSMYEGHFDYLTIFFGISCLAYLLEPRLLLREYFRRARVGDIAFPYL